MTALRLVHSPDREEYWQTDGVVDVVFWFKERALIADAIALAMDRLGNAEALDWRRLSGEAGWRDGEFRVQLTLAPAVTPPPVCALAGCDGRGR